MHEPRFAVDAAVRELAEAGAFSYSEIAQLIGASYASVARWAQEGTSASPDVRTKIEALLTTVRAGQRPNVQSISGKHKFASRGARKAVSELPLFQRSDDASLADRADPSLIQRLKPSAFWGDGAVVMADVLADHTEPAVTPTEPSAGGISAGKNTYTYDAHTYHTKVPPQGIAEVIKQYLPAGGVVLDPFAGSGMTGVAARVLGADVVLNELSPAASFISDRFVRNIDPQKFAQAVRAVCAACEKTRARLYTTECRECGRPAEIQYTVWSYRVACPECLNQFTLWDHCRYYGRTVREHKILSEFPCPCCHALLKKSRLQRSDAVPVVVGYKCCKRAQVEHPPTEADRDRIREIEEAPDLVEGFYPKTELPDGVNLSQPKRHGLTSVDKFYTPRNLSAMSHLWEAIHRIDDAEVAGYVAFVFTSLYQRVTRLSEFRFWGGSGNTAHFNVPYIFNEANVFVTFERKARTILDHLETTATHYSGRAVVHTGSATDLSFVPDASIDLVFTDPPFGGNINYSEMNILWEAWLGVFTDARNEAIVNKFQGKDAAKYGDLMEASFRECYRVLRPGSWMMVVFMNSAQRIWEELKEAVADAGFSVERIDIFDKQHGTFKQFVSDNTAGSDLILHCRKQGDATKHPISTTLAAPDGEAIAAFLKSRRAAVPHTPFLHVSRAEEVDYRLLYSEWLAATFRQGKLLGFAAFRHLVSQALSSEGSSN